MPTTWYRKLGPDPTWKKHQELFQLNTRARVIAILDEFFNCRILEDEDIGPHAARLRTVVAQLKDTEYLFENLYQAFKLISGKDKYYGPVPKGKSSTSENGIQPEAYIVVISQNFKEPSSSLDKN
ncbi:hypothetical protein NPIL_688251 [Nephila pilipes]|uniref:Uncharacterized protein n=1 Tax=Nephila pilipes TaxID=299642 RepID=A0A8X6P125_NEPPI|nr:hypothetical protein NPIL_688251 [Nephila pilipes]